VFIISIDSPVSFVPQIAFGPILTRSSAAGEALLPSKSSPAGHRPGARPARSQNENSQRLLKR